VDLVIDAGFMAIYAGLPLVLLVLAVWGLIRLRGAARLVPLAALLVGFSPWIGAVVGKALHPETDPLTPMFTPITCVIALIMIGAAMLVQRTALRAPLLRANRPLEGRIPFDWRASAPRPRSGCCCRCPALRTLRIGSQSRAVEGSAAAAGGGRLVLEGIRTAAKGLVQGALIECDRR
jgi:hypothetical protein